MVPLTSDARHALQVFSSFNHNSFEDDGERKVVLAAARKLSMRLEKPWETIVHLTWAIPSAYMALKVGVDVGLFEKMKEFGKPMTPQLLSKEVDVDPVLLGRIMKHLGSTNFLIEHSEDTYSLEQFTECLVDPVVASSLDFLTSFDIHGPAMLDTPEYLAATSYKIPTDTLDGPWQHMTQSPGQQFWHWLADHPKKQTQFGKFMSGYTSERQSWVDIYPTEQIASKAQDRRGVIFVDVGGGVGQDAVKLVKKHPELAGHVIVQDQTPVLKDASPPDSISLMPHDFFTSQPVEGSHFYYLHSILHDWPDESCVLILQRLREVSLLETTKLLINENVVPATNAPHHITAQDLMMMGIFATKERTERDWRSLLERGGFRVTAVYPGAIESVLEAVPM